MLEHPYALSRQPVYARNGVVATSQPLAAQAGLFILREGGNAVDAAIATAAALTVVEPTSNGLGADAFALVWDGESLHGLNGSGRSPAGCSLAALHEAGLENVPAYGWWPVTVPAAPRAWADLHARFGRLPFARLFSPAIEYARDGFALSPVLAHFWQEAGVTYAACEGPEFAPWHETFLPDGFTPRPGATWRSADHAATLEAIAESRAEAFYTGPLAERIDRFARASGGLLRGADLAAHAGEWVAPISTRYRDAEVWEIPPSGQGIVALQALGILDGLRLPEAREDDRGLHLQIEAIKLAFSDARAYVADPAHAEVPVRGLLAPEYLADRRALIGSRALVPSPGSPPAGGTVYLAAADRDGMMVSFIQSNYLGFGSGVVVPGTGIALANRGYNFSGDPGHPNVVAPGKRPYNTIIPAFLTRAGQALGPFGVMGGYMQPQGHLQVVVNTLDYGMDPQAALDAPRWCWQSGLEVWLEHAVPHHVAWQLAQRGHQVSFKPGWGPRFGRGQIIWKQGDVLVAGSDSRTDGAAAAW
ncbi:MAG TPA: gamma-glutamyltransferase family protein [Gammaproteobacteria bacterium]|nr:gamma-glutamyltransferase family protein [Gammaproteobacteria bacterium]